MTEYLQALLATVTIGVIVPLVILVGLFVFCWWVIHKASEHKHFHIEECLLDHDGKTSATRLIALMAFAVSSWYIAVMVINRQADAQHFLIYLAAWSGSLVLKEAASRWNGALPLAKGGEP